MGESTKKEPVQTKREPIIGNVRNTNLTRIRTKNAVFHYGTAFRCVAIDPIFIKGLRAVLSPYPVLKISDKINNPEKGYLSGNYLYKICTFHCFSSNTDEQILL